MGRKCIRNSREEYVWHQGKRQRERKGGEKKAGTQVEATPVLLVPCGEAETVGASKRGAKRKDQTTRAADLHQSALYYFISQRAVEPVASSHTEEPDVPKTMKMPRCEIQVGISGTWPENIVSISGLCLQLCLVKILQVKSNQKRFTWCKH